MKEHKSYFDILRLIAAYSVVLMHTAANGLRYDVSMRPGWVALIAASSFTFCAVPLFFMMSGYLMLSAEPDVEKTIKKRIPGLLVPLLFWSLLHILWNAYISNTWTLSFFRDAVIDALQKPVSTSFWFMYTLMGMYIIAPFLALALRNADEKQHRFLICLILLLKLLTLAKTLFPGFYASHLSFDALSAIDFFGGHLCSFVLGWYLGKWEKKASSPVLAAAALACYLVIVFGTLRSSISSGAYVQSFQSQSSFLEIFLAAALFLLARNISFSSEGKMAAMLNRLAQDCFCVYLSHALLLRIYSFNKGSMPLSFTSIVMLATVVFIVGMALGEFLRVIPVLSYISLGKK